MQVEPQEKEYLETLESLEYFEESFEDYEIADTWQTVIDFELIKKMTSIDGFCPFVEPKMHEIQMETEEEPKIDLFYPFEDSCTIDEVKDLIYEWLFDNFAYAYIFYRDTLHNNLEKNLLHCFEDIEHEFQMNFPQLVHEINDFKYNQFPVLLYERPIRHDLCSMIGNDFCTCCYCAEHLKTYYQRPDANIETYVPKNLPKNWTAHKKLREARTTLNDELYGEPMRIASKIRIFYKCFMQNQKGRLLSITLNEFVLEFSLYSHANATENKTENKTEKTKGPYTKHRLDYWKEGGIYKRAPRTKKEKQKGPYIFF